MTPEEILSQLPADLPREKVRAARISASPTSSLGESYLLSCGDAFFLFTRDSMLSPFAKHDLKAAPSLSTEGFLLVGEHKIKVSFFEQDEIKSILNGRSGVASNPDKNETTSVLLQPETPRAAPVVPAPMLVVTSPSPHSSLSAEEAAELSSRLEEEVVAAIDANDLELAKRRLLEMSRLPLDDPDDLDAYAAGAASINALQQGRLRDAFFLAGDYDYFYHDFQESWSLSLGKKLEEAGEKRLAAALYFAAMEESEASRMLKGQELDEEALRPVIYQEAQRFLREHLQQHPDDHLAMSYLVTALVEEEKHEEVLEIAKKIIALAPHRGDGYQKAEEALLALKRPQEARAIAEDALAKNPTAAWAHSLLGEALHESGDASQSRKAFEAALTRDPSNFAAFEGLQKILRSQQDHPALAELLERSLGNFSYKKKELLEEIAQLYEGPLRNASKAKEFRTKANQTRSLIAPQRGGSSVVWWALIIAALLWFFFGR